MQQMFQKREVEQEIEMIYDQINHLLDLRNMMQEQKEHQQIDIRLNELTHRLFILEA